MIPLLKPGAKLLKVDGPVIETARLVLRPWRGGDVAANTAMLSDPDTARFITPDGKAITTEIGGWRNAAVISGHWALHGFGMFAIEEKSSRRYIGRVGPWCPPGWPGFEVGWGIDREYRGKGYAVEAARASIDWGSRPSRSTRSFIASKPSMHRRKRLRGDWERGGMARSISSARSMNVG
ncbi:GNAT family N-acetyltransferase [Bradyrhizobium retamae]|uniref:GNAT family N-acetyltransferase n=1 Tax=Bradyrhizobium retamae TaxID=1300035 RepID=UPI000A7D8619|nr:GNAT family N-acetyltransferase [Bradyrhizobium retamae]